MSKEILEYREKHPKGKWCKWYKYNTWQDCYWITCYGECILKDKIIHYDSILRLCKYYEDRLKIRWSSLCMWYYIIVEFTVLRVRICFELLCL